MWYLRSLQRNMCVWYLRSLQRNICVWYLHSLQRNMCVWYLRSLQRRVYMCVVPSSYRLPTGIKHSDCLTALLPTKVAAFNSGYCTNHQNCVCDRFPHLTVCITVRWKLYPLHEIASPVKWLTSLYTMQDSMYSHITQNQKHVPQIG